jgi:hypothetical protein
MFDPETLKITADPQSTKRRWIRGEFITTHKACP